MAEVMLSSLLKVQELSWGKVSIHRAEVLWPMSAVLLKTIVDEFEIENYIMLQLAVNLIVLDLFKRNREEGTVDGKYNSFFDIK